MATAIAEAGLELHAWARRPASLAPLADTLHVVHHSVSSLSGVVDLVALCISTDDDVLRTVRDDVLPTLRAGGIVVNHGTGTPNNARLLAEICSEASVEAIDAPVSGGRPAAEARALTVLAGGPTAAITIADPIRGDPARGLQPSSG